MSLPDLQMVKSSPDWHTCYVRALEGVAVCFWYSHSCCWKIKLVLETCIWSTEPFLRFLVLWWQGLWLSFSHTSVWAQRSPQTEAATQCLADRAQYL